jgi:hypothetical protein
MNSANTDELQKKRKNTPFIVIISHAEIKHCEMKYSNWLEFLMNLYWTQMNESCDFKNANVISKAHRILYEAARLMLHYSCILVFWGPNYFSGG